MIEWTKPRLLVKIEDLKRDETILIRQAKTYKRYRFNYLKLMEEMFPEEPPPEDGD